MQVVRGNLTGEVVRDGKIIGRNYNMWCARHGLFVSDPKNPTDVEKKAWAKARMRDVPVGERDGSISWYKVCAKCGQTVLLYNIPKEDK